MNVGIVCAVGILTIFWLKVGELVRPLRHGVCETCRGRKNLTGCWHRNCHFSCPYPYKQIGFSSKVLDFPYVTDQMKNMSELWKRLEEKIKNSPSYICYLEQAEDVTEPKSLDRQ